MFPSNAFGQNHVSTVMSNWFGLWVEFLCVGEVKSQGIVMQINAPNSDFQLFVLVTWRQISELVSILLSSNPYMD